VLTGSAAEADLVGRVRAVVRSPSISLAGRLDLTGLCAVIAAADVVVSNNTAPVHIAAAVGTPVVDLYALTNPQHTPWLVPHRLLYHDVPCRYCYKSVCPAAHNDCLRRVEPEAVAAAAVELLQRAALAPFEPGPQTLPELVPASAPVPALGGA
jgi:ADP-heptose:LPS heptosyltransferase